MYYLIELELIDWLIIDWFAVVDNIPECTQELTITAIGLLETVSLNLITRKEPPSLSLHMITLEKLVVWRSLLYLC